MGRRKAQSSRIRAIHYKTDSIDEVYYLDHSGRHLDRQIEKIEKPKHFKYLIKSENNDMHNIKKPIKDFQPSNIIKSNNIPVFHFKDLADSSQKISQNFINAYDKCPAASLMWINNPDYSQILSEINK